MRVIFQIKSTFRGWLASLLCAIDDLLDRESGSALLSGLVTALIGLACLEAGRLLGRAAGLA